MQHGHTRGNVPGACTEVDQRLTLTCAVPGFDRRDADFHLESSGDAIARFEGVVFRRLAMLMEVNEAGRHDEPTGIDNAAACERSFGDSGDFAILDADIANGIETCFRIDNTAVRDDSLVLLG